MRECIGVHPRIIAPYFAYEPTERKNPTKAAAAARAATMIPGNVVFMVGDMNLLCTKKKNDSKMLKAEYIRKKMKIFR